MDIQIDWIGWLGLALAGVTQAAVAWKKQGQLEQRQAQDEREIRELQGENRRLKESVAKNTRHLAVLMDRSDRPRSVPPGA